MKLILALVLCLAPTLATAKGKEVPLPRPSPIRVGALDTSGVGTSKVWAQAVNPDPFKVNPQSTTQPQPTPVVVTTQPTSTSGEILQYLWAAIAAIFTGLFGKAVIKPPVLPGAKIDVDHPDIRRLIDQAALKAIETGLPGQAAQLGLGMIPGVGGLAARLEPMMRRVATDVLKRRIAAGEVDITLESSTTAAPPEDSGFSPWSGLPQDILHRVEGRLMQRLEERMAEVLKGKGV